MSLPPLALVILLLGTLPAMGATLGPEVGALADAPRGLGRATGQVAPQPPFLRPPPFAEGPPDLTAWLATRPIQAGPKPVGPSATDLVQLPLPGAMPLLLGALAGFIALGRRRSRPAGGA